MTSSLAGHCSFIAEHCMYAAFFLSLLVHMLLATCFAFTVLRCCECGVSCCSLRAIVAALCSPVCPPSQHSICLFLCSAALLVAYACVHVCCILAAHHAPSYANAMSSS